MFAFMCEDVNFRNLSVWGAPGIDLDETSGNLYDLTLDGENSGVGLTIRHGITEPVVLEEVQILDYSVGLKLHAHDFEEPAPVLLTNASIQSVEAISVEFFDLRMSSSTVNGDISISNSRVDACLLYTSPSPRDRG